MRIILLGAPGSGKGTQAKLLSKKMNITHISTGDIFRENIKKNTDLGKKAKFHIDQGKLVPDDITCDMLKERLSLLDYKDGFILDGFPRNINQAEFLDSFLNSMGKKIDSVIQIEVANEEILKRLFQRRSCPKCGAVYNLINQKPVKGNLCDFCRTELVWRSDDTEDIILNRLGVYKKETEPLVKFYSRKGLLFNVNGNSAPDKVLKEILQFLGNYDRLDK